MSLGTDLALTRLMVADEWGAHDLYAEPSRRTGAPGPRLADSPTGVLEPTDLLTLTERDNLGQALIMRLLTPVGGLAAVGHPQYGSRLGHLVGRQKDDIARFLCRRYVIEAVSDEPRAELLYIVFADPALERDDTLAFTVHVRPRPKGDPFALGFEVAL